MSEVDLPYRNRKLFNSILSKHKKNIKEMLRVEIKVVEENGEKEKIIISGNRDDIEFAKNFFLEISQLFEEGKDLEEEEFLKLLNNLPDDESFRLDSVSKKTLLSPFNRKRVKPKTFNQHHYIKAMKENDIVFSIGPAGTGKTYLAMAYALSSLGKKQVKRIILTRPVVEAGEKLGFLPGDIPQKVNPYLRPLYDAIFDLLDPAKARNFLEDETIEIAPLAYMRGRTLNDAFVILDEAQNTTHEQMKMFLTRFGVGSKAVITGDITQIDLPSKVKSGLVEAIKILKGIKKIEIVYFTEKDVVRHCLVKDIIKAYDKYENKR